jgi:predicted CopG family antitoxin
VGYEPQLNAKGERLIWIEQTWHAKLAAMRAPGESYSNVILRLIELEARGG